MSAQSFTALGCDHLSTRGADTYLPGRSVRDRRDGPESSHRKAAIPITMTGVAKARGVEGGVLPAVEGHSQGTAENRNSWEQFPRSFQCGPGLRQRSSGAKNPGIQACQAEELRNGRPGCPPHRIRTTYICTS